MPVQYNRSSFSLSFPWALVLIVLLGGRLVQAAEIGFVGMQVQGVTAEIYEALGLEIEKGVLVRDVALGEASDKAGFKRGDLIHKFAAKKIMGMESLVKAVGSSMAGETVKVTVLRSGNPVILSLKLGKWKAPWLISKSSVARLPDSGLTMASLTQKLRNGFDLRWGTVGVVVTLVGREQGEKGLRRGDLIIQVNQKNVWLPEHIISAYKEAKKLGRKKLLLLIERSNGFHFMVLPIR